MGKLLVRWMQDSTIQEAIQAHEKRRDSLPGSPCEAIGGAAEYEQLVAERSRRIALRNAAERRFLARLGWNDPNHNTADTKDIA